MNRRPIATWFARALVGLTALAAVLAFSAAAPAQPQTSKATAPCGFVAKGAPVGRGRFFSCARERLAVGAVQVVAITGEDRCDRERPSSLARGDRACRLAARIAHPDRARTTLSYDGAPSADFNDPAVLSARLTRTDNASPLASKTVTLTVGSETCSERSRDDCSRTASPRSQDERSPSRSAAASAARTA